MLNGADGSRFSPCRAGIRRGASHIVHDSVFVGMRIFDPEIHPTVVSMTENVFRAGPAEKRLGAGDVHVLHYDWSCDRR